MREGKMGAKLSLAAVASSLTIGLGMNAGAGEADWTIARTWNEQLLEAIRHDVPRPTVHARNLWHTSIAMYDAWWAYYGDVEDYYLVDESAAAAEAIADGADPEDAIHETISYAMLRILQHRFPVEAPDWQGDGGVIPTPGGAFVQEMILNTMNDLGYDPDFESTEGNSPAAIGNRIAQAVIDWGHTDGANEVNNYADTTGYQPENPPMVFELAGCGNGFQDPNRWQPLSFDYLVLQNGIVIGQATQVFINPNWGQVRSFAFTDEDEGPENVFLDPGPPPQLGGEGDEAYKANIIDFIEKSAKLDPNGSPMIDIGPYSNHNNPLGSDDGTGYRINPVTGEPYEPNMALEADYGRVLAEFWADGPASETPPGHWNTLYNQTVQDSALFENRIGGEGPVVDDLEMDVKTYFTMNGAVHDAAVHAWGVKGYYDYSRPITHVRWAAHLGQSSDPKLPNYHPQGIPLVDGLIEIMYPEDLEPGGKFHHIKLRNPQLDPDGKPIYDDEGNLQYVDLDHKIAIYCWKGHPEDPKTDTAGSEWKWAERWLPYQKITFVTPAFAGYVSGHSTFSRAAAEVLTGITGSPYFPGGMGSYTRPAGTLEFEYGPENDVTLQWAAYKDAADEAGVSRRWGGIHPIADDFPARIAGAEIGHKAWNLSQKYFAGVITCPLDIDNSGMVDVPDLLEVLAGWGSDDPVADINTDGSVDVNDLLEVLAAWGPACPE